MTLTSMVKGPWRPQGAYMVNEIVSFGHESMNEVLEWCAIAAQKAENGELIDLTKPTDEMGHFYEEREWGTSLDVIKNSRSWQ